MSPKPPLATLGSISAEDRQCEQGGDTGAAFFGKGKQCFQVDPAGLSQNSPWPLVTSRDSSNSSQESPRGTARGELPRPHSRALPRASLAWKLLRAGNEVPGQD